MLFKLEVNGRTDARTTDDDRWHILTLSLLPLRAEKNRRNKCEPNGASGQPRHSPLWSEYSLCAQSIAVNKKFIHADGEDSDQTELAPRLICVFSCSGFSHVVAHIRVKSGKFGRSAKFGQRSCFIHVLIIGIRNKLTMQTVKILMRRLIRSRLIWISTVFKCMSGFNPLSKVTWLYSITYHHKLNGC